MVQACLKPLNFPLSFFPTGRIVLDMSKRSSRTVLNITAFDVVRETIQAEDSDSARENLKAESADLKLQIADAKRNRRQRTFLSLNFVRSKKAARQGPLYVHH